MAKIWKKHKDSPVGKCINKPWHIHTMKNSITVKMDDLKKYLHYQSQKKTELKEARYKKILII